MRPFRDRQEPGLVGPCERDVLGVQFGECACGQGWELDLDAARSEQFFTRLAAFQHAFGVDEAIPEGKIRRRLALFEIDDRDMIGFVANQTQPASDGLGGVHVGRDDVKQRQSVAMGLEGVEEAVEAFAAVDDSREIGQKPAREVMDVEFFARLDGIEQDVAFVIRATVIVADAFDRVCTRSTDPLASRLPRTRAVAPTLPSAS
ncbi:MAG: hypothetical protein FD139_2541 [Methylocystaceae bacterium]|nr:MAG: hypothetical protein FD148_432 [Methylocystaceae bacterium]KAF0207988.1 MAG: hypothetical protein FD172_3566 [Methylocystaceae bacterium]TXT44075.1 MAG: hypothetical protein FD139_2541 [Methylocystaceae bacterium]